MHRSLRLLTALGLSLVLPGCGGPTFKTPPTPHISSISDERDCWEFGRPVDRKRFEFRAQFGGRLEY